MGLRPFLKWAGGKRWLIDHSDFQTPEITGIYVEPFLGGGAVFFSLLPASARLSDANARLVETYVAIRDHWADVVTLLEAHHNSHSRDYYYSQRDLKYSNLVPRAAQFIYLNRACWNGLYRVNRQGAFNVPIGTKDWILSADDDFASISRALQAAEIVCCDFRDSIAVAKSGDFIFCDPPYTTAHNFNGFVKYNESIFSWDDQKDLQRNLLSADQRGASFLLTNADHPSLHDLYVPHWEPTQLYRHTVISGKPKGRTRTSEILVKNYGSPL